MIKWLLVLSVFAGLHSYAQTLDKVGSNDMVKVSGGINYAANFYDSYGKPLNRDPFNWVLGGNVNVSILDVSLPFTFTFTNQGGAYTQPFKIAALHPSYKKFKSHIGNISMSLSPYTLTGITVAGAGLEYAPGKWKFQAIGGRFRKAIEYIPELDNYQTVAYTRWGGAISAGYDNKGFGFQFITMKALDDPNSLTFVPEKSTVRPQDNVVSSLKLKGTLLKGLTAETEFATSLVTRDRTSVAAVSDDSFLHSLSPLVGGNTSTDLFTAANGTLTYRWKSYAIGTKYERIDPGYTTLGGLYFNNDLENFTITPTAAFLKGKLNLNLNIGIQRNNLSNTAANATNRWVGTLSISSSPVKNLSLSGNYSNFSSFSRRNPAADPFYNPIGDTLNYYQISSNGSFSSSYSFGKKIKNSLSFNTSISISENITGRLDNAAAFGMNVNGTNAAAPVQVMTGMLGHTLGFTASKWNVGWTVNASQSETMGNTTFYAGPGINCSKAFSEKKLNFTTGLIYNQNYLNSLLTNHVLNARVGLNFAPAWWDKKYGKLNVGINGSVVNRFPVVNVNSAQRDLTILFNLNYSF